MGDSIYGLFHPSDRFLVWHAKNPSWGLCTAILFSFPSQKLEVSGVICFNFQKLYSMSRN